MFVGACVDVGAAVVGAAVGAAVVGATVEVAVAVGDGLGEGDADVPANLERPPPTMTPIRRSVKRLPATAARIRSIQRGPRRGGGAMIFVVSDMTH